MKKRKNLITLLLFSFSLILFLPVNNTPVRAANESISLQIDNDLNRKAYYEVYKIFDAELNGNKYKYSTTSDDPNVTALLNTLNTIGQIPSSKIEEGIEKGWFSVVSSKVMSNENDSIPIKFMNAKGGFYFLDGNGKMPNGRMINIQTNFTLTPQESIDKILTIIPLSETTITVTNPSDKTTVSIDKQTFDIYRIFDAEKTVDGYNFTTKSTNPEVINLLDALNKTGKVDPKKIEEGMQKGWFTHIATEVAQGEETVLPIQFEDYKGGYYVITGTAKMNNGKLTKISPIDFSITPQEYVRKIITLSISHIPELVDKSKGSISVTIKNNPAETGVSIIGQEFEVYKIFYIQRFNSGRHWYYAIPPELENDSSALGKAIYNNQYSTLFYFYDSESWTGYDYLFHLNSGSGLNPSTDVLEIMYNAKDFREQINTKVASSVASSENLTMNLANNVSTIIPSASFNEEDATGYFYMIYGKCITPDGQTVTNTPIFLDAEAITSGGTTNYVVNFNPNISTLKKNTTSSTGTVGDTITINTSINYPRIAHFFSESTIPGTTADKYKFILKETIAPGLSLTDPSNIKIECKINNEITHILQNPRDYIIQKNPNGFELIFNISPTFDDTNSNISRSHLLDDKSNITITYPVKINEKALTEGTKSETVLTYSSDIAYPGKYTATAHASTDITVEKPVKLPGVGGVGTTLFFVIGGLLIVGAVAILISRKRHSNDSGEE